MKPKKNANYKLCRTSGKRMIRDEKTAIRIMNAVNDKHGNRVVQSVYQCDECNNWHLTKMTRSQRKRLLLYSNLPEQTDETIISEAAERLSYLKNKNRIL